MLVEKLQGCRAFEKRSRRTVVVGLDVLDPRERELWFVFDISLLLLTLLFPGSS